MTIAKSIMNDFPGRKLVDATKPLKVTVKREDVSRADRKEPRSCALAWATWREQEVEEVIVYQSITYLVYADRIVRYHNRQSTAQEIVAYDRGGSFETGVYYLSPPCPSMRLDAQRKKGTKRGPHSNLMPRPTRHKTVGVRGYQ